MHYLFGELRTMGFSESKKLDALGYAQLWFNKANVLHDLGKYEEALELFDKAISFNPNHFQAWTNKGLTLEKLGRFHEALDTYNHALEIRNSYLDALHGKARVLLALKKYKDAINEYKKILGITNRDLEAWINLSNAYAQLKDYQNALDTIDKAITLFPEEPLLHYNKGILLEIFDEKDTAYASFRRAVRYNPNNVTYLIEIADLALDLGRYKDAIRYFTKLIEKDSSNADYWEKKGIALMAVEKFGEALDCFNRALGLNPNKVSAIYGKALSLKNLGKDKESKALIKKAESVYPYHTA